MVKRAGVYVPLLQRKRMPTPEEVNERYRLGRGEKKLGRKAAAAAPEPTADDHENQRLQDGRKERRRRRYAVERIEHACVHRGPERRKEVLERMI